MDLAALFADAEPTVQPALVGRWCAVRLQPDPATGESLNIGVVFCAPRKKPVFRLLPHARAFKCLYGPEGLESFGFLLKVMQEQLVNATKADAMPRVSPQVSFSPWKFAAGDSADEILGRLYERVVTLGRYCEPETDKADSNTVSNSDFRKAVRGQIKQDQQIFRDDLVTVLGPDGRTHHLDMPIWHEPGGLFPDMRLGTLVSCHYKAEVYRKAMLGPACQHFNTAVQTRLANATGLGFLIALRPAENTPGFTAADIKTIENEIDELTWPFQKRANLKVHVVHSSGEAAQLVRQFHQ